jgi:hypothetical protein
MPGGGDSIHQIIRKKYWQREFTSLSSFGGELGGLIGVLYNDADWRLRVEVHGPDARAT